MIIPQIIAGLGASPPVIPPSGPYNDPTVESVISNVGGTYRYEGFFFPCVLTDNSIWTMWKRSSNHVLGEYLWMALARDGGTATPWTPNRQVTVDGVGISGYALGATKSGNYIYINYQDDATYQTLKFARALITDIQSNFNTFTFTSCGSVSFTSGWTSSPYGRMITWPSGKMQWSYYSMNPAGDRTVIGVVESTTGTSWAVGPTIRDSNDAGAFNGVTSVEPSMIILPGGTTDADTKVVCLTRNYGTTGNAYFMHHHSTGPSGWTTDQVNYMYAFGNSNGSPVSISYFGGLIYITNGARYGFEPYKLQYTTIGVNDFFTNVQTYTTATTIYTANGGTGAGGVNFGYSMDFERNNELWTHIYDEIVGWVTDVQTFGLQIKIADLL